MRLPWRRRAKVSTDVVNFNQHQALLQAGRIDNSQIQRDFASMDDYFSFNNMAYRGTPTALSIASNQEGGAADFESYINRAFKANSVIWSCEQRRLNVFSEARFQFRRLTDGRPGELHGSPSTRLHLLDHPWTNGTTGDLLTRALLHADFAGNAYIVRITNANGESQLRLLRPDWVYIIMGSHDDPAVTPDDVESEIIAYLYFPGGLSMYGEKKEPVVFLPDEVAHFAPNPDPLAHYKGMSWLTPLFYELQGDQAASAHKMSFFRNGASLQYVVTLDKDVTEPQFTRFVALMNAQTKGVGNAYKTLYMGGGADVKAVGADLRQLDFKAVQGAGETRIAAAAGVPPIIVGLSEGLSAGTYNNYGQAKRSFVDGTVRPLWRNFCGSMSTLVNAPNDSELWYDDRDIPYLREDETDRVKIVQLEMATASAGVMAGWEPDSVIDAVMARDLSILKGNHTGLFSVQLQPPLLPGQQRPTNLSGHSPTQVEDTQAVTGKPATPPQVESAPAEKPKPKPPPGRKAAQ